VEKNVSAAVTSAALADSTGTLTTGTGSIGTLANDGVGLAPYHEFATKVPPGLQSEIQQLRADIISGKVAVTSPSGSS
jgi:basic membrane protein A and related proteins